MVVMSSTRHITNIKAPLIAQRRQGAGYPTVSYFSKEALSMSTKQSDLSAFGKAQTEGMLNLQKELLETYEQASRAWLDRVRPEVELWSRLGEKLTATRSVPEAMDAYQNCVGARMHMAAEAGQRLFNACQNIKQKMSGSLNGGRWPGRR